MCDQTMRSTVRGVEGKSSICPMIESIRALWKRHPKQSIPVGIGVVHGGGDSIVHRVQKV